MRITIEVNQPTWLVNRPVLKKALVFTVFVGLLVIPGTVIASHQFADVPDSQAFHTQIGAIKNAGITSGSTECGTPPPGQTFYCPESLVRRDAMAAFMHRGFGRAGRGFGGEAIETDGATNTGASVVVDTGGVPGGQGFVHVTGALTFTETEGDLPCPCWVYMWLRQADASGTTTEAISWTMRDFKDQAISTIYGTVSNTWVFPVPTGTQKTFQVRYAIEGDTSGGDTLVDTQSVITALYIPFSNDGDNTLAGG